MKRVKILLLTVLVSFLSMGFAQEIPDPLMPPRLVNDFAGLLNQNEWNRLERKLRDYHDTTSTQIYVVIVNDLMGYDIADFTFQLGEKWGVGQKGKNNGVIVTVKTKVGNERGEVMIATGYGLEDVIPDAIANRIIDREIVPNFREGNYYMGLDAATSTIIDLASGKFTADEYGQDDGFIGGIIAIAFLVFFFVLFSKVNKTRSSSIGHNLPFWIALGMLSSGGGGGRSGGFGSFSSGSGGFGGFSGGGGGSFGGGGARGSW